MSMNWIDGRIEQWAEEQRKAREAKVCPCGSGHQRRPVYDQDDEFSGYVCDGCDAE